MNDMDFFECDNPGCRLRFPGYEATSRWKRCPACRSSIHVVERAWSHDERDYSLGLLPRWHVEGLLDNIRSTWNVGSIFRTSDGAGVQKLYLCGITATPENPKVKKTALGAEQSVLWEKYNNGVDIAKVLKSDGKKLWVLEDLPGAQPLFNLDLDSPDVPVILIVGNEVSGVDPGIVELSDKVISIPMYGNKQSYNVAVAFGIAISFMLYRHNVSQGSDSIFPNT
jgi:23S rRNA (guanosine2251-2'-O)-methyltransferase